MIENLPTIALYLLNECVLIEEKRSSVIPVWVSAEDWHKLIMARLNIEMPTVIATGQYLIKKEKIEAHQSGRMIRPNFKKSIIKGAN